MRWQHGKIRRREAEGCGARVKGKEVFWCWKLKGGEDDDGCAGDRKECKAEMRLVGNCSVIKYQKIKEAAIPIYHPNLKNCPILFKAS